MLNEPKQDKPLILIIDDDPNNVDILELDLEDAGYPTLSASDGEEGWRVLQENKDKVKTILLDRMMPNLDGMGFMARLKADNTVSHIPVIMQTAAAEREQVTQGIEAGVYYYLTKPYEHEVMLSIVNAAVDNYADVSRLRREVHQFKSKLYMIKESYFEVSTLEDIRYLATFLANHYPDPDRVIMGISELLINAIEHGNLGITYDEKTKLMQNHGWEEEVLRRQELPENAVKTVEAHYRRGQDKIVLTISDQGEGFEWENFMEISPDRATHSHGRGIAMSKMMSFDDITYQGNGSTVVAIVNL